MHFSPDPDEEDVVAPVNIPAKIGKGRGRRTKVVQPKSKFHKLERSINHYVSYTETAKPVASKSKGEKD